MDKLTMPSSRASDAVSSPSSLTVRANICSRSSFPLKLSRRDAALPTLLVVSLSKV